MAIKEEGSIGARLVAALGAKDLKEAAQIVGENYSSLHNWSTGRRDFPTNVLIKIARMANVSIDWLLTGDDGAARAAAAAGFERLIEEKIRAVVRDELASSAALHEKIQGIVLALRPNVAAQRVFEPAPEKEERAA